ncbi:MAG TPA: hypothetical protein VG125_25830 [Pirellulales bacterium]|nr:hypothetical protein [Pirellulales bacterium]
MSSARKARDFQRQSWKGGGKGDDDPRTARRVRRVLGTLVGVGLLAWFAWLLWPRPVATTYVLCAAVDDYDVLQAPPLAFAVETIADFEPLAKRSGISWEHKRDVKTAKALADLFAKDLPRSQPQNDDVVVVYVAAHGVSQSDGKDGAQAWLLGSDYGALRDVGKLAIKDLLTDLHACKARAKLLVLDAGSVESDPALGMAVNEFPALVAEEVSRLPGDDVWVLLSHRLFEKSHAAFADRRSVFGYYVARGLQGGPEVDRNADGVDLSELFDYVRDHVARYVWHATDQQETQTPVLLARDADPAKARDLKLTMRKPAEAAAVPTDKKPAEKPAAKPEEKSEKKTARLLPFDARARGLTLAGALSADSPAPSTDKSALAGRDAVSPAPAQGQAPPKEPAPSSKSDASPKADADAPAPVEKGRPALEPTPDKSDEAVVPETSTAVKRADAKQTPVDPVLTALRAEWRECEGRCDRSKARWTPVDYAPRGWLRQVEQLKGYELQWLFGAPSSTAKRIGQVGDDTEWDALRRRFDESRAKPGFEQRAALERAVQLRDDLLFALRYDAAWSTVDGSVDDVMSLATHLNELLRALNEPPGQGAGDAAQWLAGLTALCNDLAGERQRFDDRVQRAVRDCLSSKRQYNAVKIEKLLRFPSIAADDRARLLARLQAAPRLAAEFAPAPTETQREERAKDAARRAGQLARVEWRLFQLADSPESDGDERFNERCNRLERSPRVDSEAARDVGLALAQSYRQVQHDLGSSASEAIRPADGLRDVRLVENRVRLADARHDTALADQLFWEVPFPTLPVDWKPNLVAGALKQGTPAEPLRTDGDAEVSWRIGNLPPGPVEATWSLEYDASLLTVDGKTRGLLPLTPQSAEAERTLTFLVRAKSDQRDTATASLVLHLAVPSAAPQTSPITLALPKWQPLELAVVQTDQLQRPPLEPDKRGIERVVLMPLPSGKTLFHLELQNPAPRERKVKYRLFAMSKSGLSAQALGAWPLRSGGEWQPNGKAIHPAPVELTLPAKGRARLSLPPFPKPAAPEAAPAPANKTAPMPEAEKGLPIGDGLICEVTDLSTDLPATSQRFWIDVAPLHPRQYLNPSVRYDPQSRRLVVVVRPRFPGRLPPEGTHVGWYTEGLEGDELNRVGGDLPLGQPEIALPSPPIDAAKIPKNRPVRVLVDVDGYPRAFRYDVRCDLPTGDVRSETPAADLRFLQPPAAPPTWLKNGTPIGAKLRADVPRGWFERRDQFVQIGIYGDSRQTVALDSDRRFEATLLPAENDGDFLVDARVDELRAEFRTDAYPDQEITLVASLGSTADGSTTDERSVGLDGNAPVIKTLTPRPIYEGGGDLVLSVIVTDDQSGVDKVEAGVDVDDSGQIKEWKRASEDDKSPGTYRVKLPTSSLSPRRWIALVQAKDRAGNASSVEHVPLEIVAKPATSGAGPKKNTTRVDGTVTFNSRAGSGFKGKFTGPKSGSVTADRNGQFTLELPPGGYKFAFEGVVNNTKVKFTQDLTVDPPGDKPQRATLAGP